MILINKSASADVMKSIISLLTAGLSGIPVYDHVPEAAELPFVIVEAATENDFSDKTRFGSNVQIDISNYSEGLESKTVQETTSAIIELLNENDLTVPGYETVGIELIRNECASADVDNVYFGTLSIGVWVSEINSAGESENESIPVGETGNESIPVDPGVNDGTV